MEFLGVYDENGKEIKNRKIARGDKGLEPNEYIKLAVVWIKCKDKYLIQKSSAQKGGDYAVSGGHVPYGISSKKQAQIEIIEELGFKVSLKDLKFLGNVKLPHCIFDAYLYENDGLLNQNFTLQKEEVENVVWCSTSDIDDLISKNLFRKSSCLQYKKFIQEMDRSVENN